MGEKRHTRPGGRRRLSAALALALATSVAGSCTKDAPSTPELDPSPVFRSGSVGNEESLGGVDATMAQVDAFTTSPQGFPRLAVTVSSRNTGTVRRENPDVQLRCDESPRGGDWFLGSTWEPSSLIDGGGRSEGVVYLGFPAKPEDGRFTVPTCTGAKLTLIRVDDETGQRIEVAIPLPEDLISDAIDAATGPALPLPPRSS